MTALMRKSAAICMRRIEIGTEKGIVIGAEKQLESVVIESFKNSIPIETIARISLISVDRVNEILVKHKII